MKYLKWINDNISEMIFIALYLFSLTPLVLKSHEMSYYVVMSAGFGICGYLCIDSKTKNTILRFCLVLGILIFGMVGLIVLDGIKSGDSLTFLQQFLSCYVGGLAGIILSGACEGIINQDKNKKNEKEG